MTLAPVVSKGSWCGTARGERQWWCAAASAQAGTLVRSQGQRRRICMLLWTGLWAAAAVQNGVRRHTTHHRSQHNTIRNSNSLVNNIHSAIPMASSTMACTSLDQGRKLENPRGTHVDTGWTYKLPTEGSQPGFKGDTSCCEAFWQIFFKNVIWDESFREP